MMGVLVRNNLQVDTNILTQSMNMAVNSVMQVFLELTYLRKLDPADLMSRRKTVEDALYVWLLERTLRRAIFEVSLPGSSNALEHWEVTFTYSETPDNQVKRAPTEELKRFCDTLKDLPPGSDFAIILCVTPEAKAVPGWAPGQIKPINPVVEKSFGVFGYGAIEGQLHYRAGTF
jgi:hypothetical protein